jgi:repressor of nif and glnA expression
MMQTTASGVRFGMYAFGAPNLSKPGVTKRETLNQIQQFQYEMALAKYEEKKLIHNDQVCKGEITSEEEKTLNEQARNKVNHTINRIKTVYNKLALRFSSSHSPLTKK